MTDTDKYEGHTEGKWILGEYKGRPSISAVEDVETPTWVRNIARGLNPSQTADHALLLDAPFLLQEIKRLRKTLACIAFSPDDPKWVSEKLAELEVDSKTWTRWME